MTGLRIALVHVRHAGTGGTERYLNHLAAHLAGAGHEPVVVCRSHEEPPHPGVRFARLRPFAIGGSWRMWSFAAAVERHVARERYDLVVGLGKTWTHDVVRLGGGLQETYLRATLARGPAGRVPPGRALRHALALRIERRALRPGAYARVIANSRMVARDVADRYAVPEGALEVVHNGVDLERFTPDLRAGAGRELRRSLGLGDADFVVLFLGTGYERKGLAVVQEAFAELAKRRPGARLVVAGYDSGRARWEARGEALGIAAASRYLGGRRDPEVCFAAADLYVLPTRYDPFANSTVEALASGLPVVTSDANGGAELIEPGATGDVVPADVAAPALADVLERWSEPELRARGAAAARREAERHGIASKMARTSEVLLAAREERAVSPART